MSTNFDFNKIEDHKFYDKYLFLIKPLGGMFYKFRFVGLENIPDKDVGGYIIASNHVFIADPGYIAYGMQRPVHFMAKSVAFEKKIFAKLLTGANAFPVVRGGGNPEALNYAVRLLKEGKILGIFPEGTRSRDGKPAKAKLGVAKIAKDAKADILPVAIYNSDNMKKHTTLTIHFGEMIPFEELGLTEEGGKEELKPAADYIMNKIKKLWGEGHCDE